MIFTYYSIHCIVTHKNLIKIYQKQTKHLVGFVMFKRIDFNYDTHAIFRR